MNTNSEYWRSVSQLAGVVKRYVQYSEHTFI